MKRIWSRVEHLPTALREDHHRSPRQGFAGLRWVAVLAIGIILALTTVDGSASEPLKPGQGRGPSHFPTVSAEHKHVHKLLDNAMQFVAPRHQMFDAISGYPFEGWNQDPSKGLFLRSFTQLTAIGQSMELLANVVAGYADSPHLSREQALAQLTRLVESLRRDQQNPELGAKGLLVNFLDLATGKRLGPLSSDVEKPTLIEPFGPERGEALWNALKAKGWIAPRNDDRQAAIVRGAEFGLTHFKGPLAPFGDEATKRKIMEILDRRVVMVVFGDNANLSASVAKTIGALLTPAVADQPEARKIRQELEQFLNAQKEGYTHLYDGQAGLFYFGWDATRNRLFGWEDLEGKWVTGHMDYFINEFRAPAIFVAARFELPQHAIGNLGFKLKPYRLRDESERFALAPWDGSAFQAMGLGLFLGELENPSWRRLLENVAEIELDYSTRHRLPGLLSESYTGVGEQYTGDVGIPELAVSPKPRITDAASLYSLGVAYTIIPARVEQFLGANWPIIGSLLNEHGPWEGFNITKQEAIRFQTSTHTISLILGFLGTGSAHLKRYAEHAGIHQRLDEFMKPGEKTDLLSNATRSFAWSDQEGGIRSTRSDHSLRVEGDQVKRVGIAFIPNGETGVNLSGTVLNLGYRSSGLRDAVVIGLKPAASTPAGVGLIPKEIITRFADTEGKTAKIEVPLPAMLGLSQIKEVVITHERAAGAGPVDLTVTQLEFLPAATATATREEAEPRFRASDQ